MQYSFMLSVPSFENATFKTVVEPVWVVAAIVFWFSSLLIILQSFNVIVVLTWPEQYELLLRVRLEAQISVLEKPK